MTIKVYQYGLLEPQDKEKVLSQMYLAHQYRNKLVEIEKKRRAALRLAQRESSENIFKIEEKLFLLDVEMIELSNKVKSSHSDKRSRSTSKEDKDAIQSLKLKIKNTKAELFAERKLIKNDASLIEKNQVIKDTSSDEAKLARKDCKVYWGTYLIIEDAMEAVKKMPLYDGSQDNDPRFVRWGHEGTVAAQIQKGLNTKDVFSPNTLAYLSPYYELKDVKNADVFYSSDFADRKSLINLPDVSNIKNSYLNRAVLHLRVASDNKKPVWVDFPMIMHRPLPKDSVIKWVKVHLKKNGNMFRWVVDFTVETSKEETSVDNTAEGTVAFDIGWRDMGEYYRSGKYQDEKGNIGEIKLSKKTIGGLIKVRELKSIRDKNFDEAREKLSAWVKVNKESLPDELKGKLENLSQWKSIERLHKLVHYWKNNRVSNDEKIMGEVGSWQDKTLTTGKGLLGWQYHDNHLWNWESSQRKKSLLRRREEYRIIAKELASKYKTIVLENFDLSKVSKTAEVEVKDDKHAVRSTKTLNSPSELRLSIVEAFKKSNGSIIKINPAGTSSTCNKCKSAQVLDHSKTEHTCTKCQAVWDREDNATANILALGLEQLSGAKKAVVARNDASVSDINEITESRYEKRTRARKEKNERMEAARKAAIKVA